MVLFYLLKFNSNKSRKTQNELGKNNDNFSIIDLNTMEFPKNIEHMKFDLLSKATKVIFDSYKALDYVNNTDNLEAVFYVNEDNIITSKGFSSYE